MAEQANIQSRVQVWKRAVALGIDTAGMSMTSVTEAVAEAEAALEAAQKKDEGGKIPFALVDLKADHLKRIASFLEVQADGKKAEIAAAIQASEAWPADPDEQAAIVAATVEA